jgi:putative transposase
LTWTTFINKQIRQLQVENDFLKKSRYMKERLALIDRSHQLSIRRQTQILSINRSQLYYKPAGENEESLVLMEQMDKLFLSDPTLGVLGMQNDLAELSFHHNVKRIRRLLRKMAIEPIYPAQPKPFREG